MTLFIKANVALIIVSASLLCFNVDSFATGCNKAIFPETRPLQINFLRQTSYWPLQMSKVESNFTSRAPSPPAIVFKLNASTKWIVTLAHTIAVWSRPHRFHAPYIVVGSIFSVYLADFLKGWINQGRPDGAPFVDPGMPSSHALVSFFSAAAWMGVVASPIGRALLLGSASVVAWLRVICGYHTVDQIVVGSVLGVLLGWWWTMLGQILFMRYSMLTFSITWFAYLSASALFIKKKISKWGDRDKHL